MVETNAHKYAQNGELIDLQREIQRDRNVVHEKDGYGSTPLSLAAANGHLEAIRVLLENGADTSCTDVDGKTPLDIAAEMGHDSIVALLGFTSFLKAREEVAIKSVINDYESKLNRLRVELEEDIEAKYKMKMDELLAQNEALVLSRDISMVQLQQETRECIVCYDSHKLSEGYECSSKHFVCKPSGCFSNQVKTQTAYDSRNHFSNNNCHIVCSICMEKIPDYVIANATPSEFTSFLKAREEVAIKSVINDYESKINRLRVELEEDIRRGNEESGMILKHCNHIIEEIITLKCPRKRCCATIVFPPDFSNCFALTCDTCGCGFCAWCFLDCGNDAHHHVPGCRPGLEPRGLFPPGGKKDFDKVHGPRRANLIKEYLNKQNLQPHIKEAILNSLKRLSLKDDNIIL